jgi:transcriptional regulator with XRE-family HTH domain
MKSRLISKIQEKFILNLRVKRNTKNLSQKDLAERLSISTEYLNRIENGKSCPSFILLDKICCALGLKPVELFE